MEFDSNASWCHIDYNSIAKTPILRHNICIIIHLYITVKPEVRLLNSRMGHSLGKETILTCVISASPMAEVFWRKGKKKMVTEYGKYRSDVYRDSPHARTLNLQIRNLQKEDFGNYTCEASNQLGGDSEIMVLYGNDICILIKEKTVQSVVCIANKKGSIMIISSVHSN